MNCDARAKMFKSWRKAQHTAIACYLFDSDSEGMAVDCCACGLAVSVFAETMKFIAEDPVHRHIVCPGCFEELRELIPVCWKGSLREHLAGRHLVN